ncbi:gasdermin-D-like [Grammomys surdaster]|uniref:gasdermin-D-like n=1 Tax=Grammomys surdaster TaxID=491861 RepID=UPI00109F4DFD|nr:gasdermin-D-like [Grammomys surdaster]
MTSAFEREIKSVIQEVGDSRGDLILVDCLRDSTSFKPYSLLSRRLSSSCFWKPRYTFLNMSIKDILEPSAPEPELECIGHFQVSDVVDWNIQGSVVMSGMGEGRISGEAAVSDSARVPMSVCMLLVNLQTWMMMQRERHLQQPENTILQQLRRRGDDVFVITKVLQTKEEVKVTQTHSQEGSGQFTVPGASCFKGEDKGHQSQKKMVTLPPGSILAFQMDKLVIGFTWGTLLLPNEKQRTFEPYSGHRRGVDRERHCFNLLTALHSIDGIPEEEEFREDFQGLCAEVKAGSLELGRLKMELKQQLLVDIGRILQDQPGLEALEASVEHILEQNSPWQGQRSLSLPSRLLGDSWDEEAPTWVLLEECGLRLQVEPPQGFLFRCGYFLLKRNGMRAAIVGTGDRVDGAHKSGYQGWLNEVQGSSIGL